MNTPQNLKYTASHEWIKTESDGTLSVGITDHAQEALGDIVFLDLPKPGSKHAAGATIAVIESVKAASDIYMPVAGEIIAANADLANAPEKNQCRRFRRVDVQDQARQRRRCRQAYGCSGLHQPRGEIIWEAPSPLRW